MTYYEELGISSSATQDDIRHAHRLLIKILHPDLQMEPGNRQLAEIQSRRINGIAEILLDSDLRDKYDATLNPRLVPPKTRPLPSNRSYPMSTLAASLLFLASALWLLVGERLTTVSPRIETHTTVPVQQPVQPIPASPLRKTSGNPSSSQQFTVVRPIEPPPRSTPPEPKPGTETTHPANMVESTPSPPPPATPPVASSPPPRTPRPTPPENPLVGTWIYIPAPITEADRSIYRPEYIEMRIRDIRGILEGQYRARYHVPDRPLSPNVGFHFAAPPGADSKSFRWSGANGLAGRVDLRLVTVNSVQVDWRVTELVEAADLVSGTAILTRVQ